ncbi:hypothetical protein TIFTF001_001272 [Ficus carica]|uniref:Uncharacterized protein n=1 Tax=Ficus carica TaxID=3494 RepID=A0AA87ZF07_FICCA|nr:hypothetical protein TIFTF001_001272 [Ficus carica]
MGKRKDSQTNNRESPNSVDNTESLVYFDLVHSQIILNCCATGHVEVGMKMKKKKKRNINHDITKVEGNKTEERERGRAITAEEGNTKRQSFQEMEGTKLRREKEAEKKQPKKVKKIGGHLHCSDFKS